MALTIFIIFLAAFLGGIGALVIVPKSITFNFLLVFIGSYLLSLTILQLLPDLFTPATHSPYICGGVLAGFLLQSFLGIFSKGVEHGHLYETKKAPSPLSAAILLGSLSIHAFLDGVIVSNVMPITPIHSHLHNVHHHLLIGIFLHKASEAFALVSALKAMIVNKRTIWFCLLIFSAASPVGIQVSQYSTKSLLLSQEAMNILMAIAVGNLLQIATTIFFELCPHHQMNMKKFLVILLGIVTVIILEYIL